MILAQPHFLLFCDTHLNEHFGARSLRPLAPAPRNSFSGRWHFVLERLDGVQKLEATDSEPAVNQDRLALLSVVRGLEALEQPSKVTLVTTSRYVSRGLRYGLNTWRESQYKWERFGVQKPIRNADLWQRIDGALNYHGVTCRLIQSEITKFENPPQIVRQELAAMSAMELPLSTPLAAVNLTVAGQPWIDAQPQASILRAILEKVRLPWQPIWWRLAAIWNRWFRAKTMVHPAVFGT